MRVHSLLYIIFIFAMTGVSIPSVSSGFALGVCEFEQLCNGGFEDGMNYWEVDGESSLISPGHTGNYALRSEQSLSSANPPNWSGTRQQIRVDPNGVYYLSAWLKWESAAQVHMKIRWLNSSGTEIATTFVMNGTDGNSGGWVQKGLIVYSPVDAIEAEIVIWHGVMNGSNVLGSMVWIDDVTFRVIPDNHPDIALPLPRMWHILWADAASVDNIRDLKEMGFDGQFKCVAAGEWQFVEAIENQYDWSNLRNCLQVARQANMYAIPELVINVPPAWFVSRFPESVLKDQRGEVKPSNIDGVPYLLSPWFVSTGEADFYLEALIDSFLDVVSEYPDVVTGVMLGNFVLNDLPWCLGEQADCSQDSMFTYWPVWDAYALADYESIFGVGQLPPVSWDDYTAFNEATKMKFREWLGFAISKNLEERYLPWLASYEGWKVINASIWNNDDTQGSVFTTTTPEMVMMKQSAMQRTGVANIIINDDNMGDCGLKEQQQLDVLLARSNGFLIFGERVPGLSTDNCSWELLYEMWRDFSPRPDGFINIELETTDSNWLAQLRELYGPLIEPLNSIYLPIVICD